ncbi:hypothetical protein FSP39_021164 [Pinctada imbricata]|uniref:Reverse transcriptase domain-containing protein n=1 Tax=Pinctada imbricata TaxID=66713 RepID=A0AA88YF26_PINIB|nr:hypothetical protein FSP39_021164 [Pinctada imbricata]
MHTSVKWKGELSKEITLQQGIRQGAKLSTLMYKRFNNNLLNELQSAKEGVKIGALDVSSPACADDIALLTESQTHAQILTNTISNASSKDRFVINPSKSEVVKFKTTRKGQDGLQITLAGNDIVQYKCGIQSSYHGIELLDIRRKDLEELEIYQRKVLKQLQSLPENAASVAVLSLVGAKTIEAEIDTNILTTFLNIAKDPSTIEHKIAHRQLLVKADTSHSWFIKAKHILQKYDLPDPMYLLQNVSSEKTKVKWKQTVKKSIDDYWHLENVIEVSSKVTLRYLYLQDISEKHPHGDTKCGAVVKAHHTVTPNVEQW